MRAPLQSELLPRSSISDNLFKARRRVNRKSKLYCELRIVPLDRGPIHGIKFFTRKPTRKMKPERFVKPFNRKVTFSWIDPSFDPSCPVIV